MVVKSASDLARKLVLLSVLGLLSGCKTFYVPPTSGPMATLTTPSAKTSVLSGTYQTMIAPVGSENCRPLENVDAEFNSPEPTVTVKLSAGQMYFVGLINVSGVGSCNVAFSFVPEEGKNYKTQYVEERQKCFGKVLEVRDGKETPVSIQPARFGAIGGVCKQ